MRTSIRLAILLAFAAGAFAQSPAPDYKNPKLPIEQRVKDLLGRMTLEEKVEQLAPNFRAGILDTTGKFNDTTARAAAGRMVEKSTTSWRASSAEHRPPSPSVTRSTASVVGRLSSTKSAACAASATDRAARTRGLSGATV